MVKSLILLWLCATAPLTAHAAEAWHWQIEPSQSSIGWQATQNNAPIEGGFADFDGHIAFHPDALASSKATISIHIASLHTSYDQAQSTLLTSDWFSAENFPKATFTTTAFEALGGNRFRTAANLSIKGKTVPVTLEFELTELSEHQARMVGRTSIKRSAFTIGWDDTSAVADEVQINVNISASR